MSVSAASFFRELFTVTSDPGLSFLPAVIIAIAVGVLLAGVSVTLCRRLERHFVRILYRAGAINADHGISLDAVGFCRGKPLGRLICHFLESPSCPVYTTATNSILDKRTYAEFAPGHTPPQTTEDASDSGAAPGQPVRDRKKRAHRPAIRMKLTPQTLFYIRPDRLERARDLSEQNDQGEMSSLLYTSILIVFLCFLALWFLDDILLLFMK